MVVLYIRFKNGSEYYDEKQDFKEAVSTIESKDLTTIEEFEVYRVKSKDIRQGKKTQGRY